MNGTAAPGPAHAPPIKYRVTWERIGRTHDVPDLDITTEDPDEIAEQIWRYARRYLGSRWYMCDVDLTTGAVHIGGGRFGQGTIAAVTT
jgi:hypothetical protein